MPNLSDRQNTSAGVHPASRQLTSKSGKKIILTNLLKYHSKKRCMCHKQNFLGIQIFIRIVAKYRD